MIYYVMDNLYFPFPIPLNQPTIHPFSLSLSFFISFFHFQFPSSENVFHWNLFCDNIFISSVLISLLLLAMVVNDFFDVGAFFSGFVSLRLWMNKNVTKMMFIFSTACTDHVSFGEKKEKKQSHTVYSPVEIQIYWPNYFCQFSPLRYENGQNGRNLPIYSHTDE